MSFNGERLTIARTRRQYSKKYLAEKVGVKPRSITGFESQEYEPSEDILGNICSILDYPREFFLSDNLDFPDSNSVSFRSQARMSARKRDAALAAGALAFEISDWVNRMFNLPEVQVPDFREVEPEIAAQLLRIEWSLGAKPIQNIIHLLESKGIKVFSLVEDCEEIDAFSMWRENQPFVFLNTIKSAERSRFDAAHELGHIVLHKHGSPTGKIAETEADAFAAEFLMPRTSILCEPRPLNLNDVMKLKIKWKVSFAAMVYRLNKTSRISRWTYENWMKQISIKGWRKKEPNPADREQSKLWVKVREVLRKNKKGLNTIASELNLPYEEVNKLVFGLVPVIISSSPNIRPVSSKAKLTVISDNKSR